MFAQGGFTAMVGVNLFTEHSAQFCGASLALQPHSLRTLPLPHLVELTLLVGLESSLLSSRLPEQAPRLSCKVVNYEASGALRFSLLAF